MVLQKVLVVSTFEYGASAPNWNDGFRGVCVTAAWDLLFDDEEKNRLEWDGISYSEKNLIKVMRSFL